MNEANVYTFRRLNSTDIFIMCKIIGKIGINEFMACFENESVLKMIRQASNGASDSTSIVGMSVMLEIANTIIKHLPECKDDIYELLAQVSDKTYDELVSMDAVIFMSMVVDFIKKDEFKDFIGVAFKLLN